MDIWRAARGPSVLLLFVLLALGATALAVGGDSISDTAAPAPTADALPSSSTPSSTFAADAPPPDIGTAATLDIGELPRAEVAAASELALEPAPVSTEAQPVEIPSPRAVAVAVEANDLLAQAFVELDFDWQSRFPNWSIGLAPEREGLRALTFPATREIEVYVRSTDTATSIARVIAHELGHVVDIERNNGADRQAWREARGIDETVPWWPTEGTYDFDTGAGDFAESFAMWLVGANSKSRVAADSLSAAQSELMAQLLAS